MSQPQVKRQPPTLKDMAEAPKHGRRRPRVTPQDLLDFVFDDIGFFLVGVPLAVVVLALWAWTPLAAVVALGVLATAALFGAVYLLRGTASRSWTEALPAALALLVVAAGLTVVMATLEYAVIDAVTWPFRWLAGQDE